MKRRELPDSYRWEDWPERSCLYLGWGWVASVKVNEVELKGRDGRRLKGQCGSIAQGKRFAERWLLGRTASTYRRAVRPERRPPTEAELAAARVLRAGATPAPMPRTAAPEDWLGAVEAEVSSVAVPFERLLALSRAFEPGSGGR